MIFFTDRNLGTKIFPPILEDAGLQVERHDRHFRDDTPDEEWLERAGSEGWIAITRDARIRYKPNELAAVVKHHVRLLVVVGKCPFADLAQSFVATRAQIEQFVSASPPPLIGKVYRASAAEIAKRPDAPGRVERWYP